MAHAPLHDLPLCLAAAAAAAAVEETRWQRQQQRLQQQEELEYQELERRVASQGSVEVGSSRKRKQCQKLDPDADGSHQRAVANAAASERRKRAKAKLLEEARAFEEAAQAKVEAKAKKTERKRKRTERDRAERKREREGGQKATRGLKHRQLLADHFLIPHYGRAIATSTEQELAGFDEGKKLFDEGVEAGAMDNVQESTATYRKRMIAAAAAAAAIPRQKKKPKKRAKKRHRRQQVSDSDDEEEGGGGENPPPLINAADSDDEDSAEEEEGEETAPARRAEVEASVAAWREKWAKASHDAEHVCHLFSHRFGGAFHEWNYLFMSASMNVSFGSFHGKLLPAPFPAANRHSHDPAVPQIRSCAISQGPSELRWPSKLQNT
jgi:hypothetical protein